MEKQKNIPELRFPEFDEVWKKKKLGDIFNITSSARVHKDEWTKEGVPFFRSSDVVATFKGTENTKAYIPFELYDSLSNKIGRVKKGDLLITGGGSIGIPFLIKDNEPIYFKDADLLWIKNTDKTNGYFLYTFFLSQTFKKYIRSISHLGTIAHYTVIQARNTPCHFPSLPEQQKIASFFTAIDQKISKLKQKKTLLEQYKKGVMQLIFSQEIRFRDDNGQEFPKWEKKKIKDLVEIKYGKDQKQISCENGKYPILGTGGEMGRTNDFLIDKPSVLIGRKGTIDKPRFMDTPFWTVDTLFYTDVFANTNPKWLFYKFETINWYLYNEASGVPSLSSSTIYTIPINLPSIQEQTKIADFVSAIDNKINHTQTQIEKTELWKKGLLQKMFV